MNPNASRAAEAALTQLREYDERKKTIISLIEGFDCATAIASVPDGSIAILAQANQSAGVATIVLDADITAALQSLRL